MRLVIVRGYVADRLLTRHAFTRRCGRQPWPHNLIKAIARVNRVFRDKQGVTSVVDTSNCQRSETGSKGIYGARVAVRQFDAHNTGCTQRKTDVLRSMSMISDYSYLLNSGHSLLAKTVNHVLGSKTKTNHHTFRSEQPKLLLATKSWMQRQVARKKQTPSKVL